MNNEMITSNYFKQQFGVDRAQRLIDNYLKEILEQYGNHQVTIVVAGTAAGKTSRIAQAIHLKDPSVHIWISQPRRKAVRKNGWWMAEEMGCRAGEIVGWKLFGDQPVESSQTKIHFRVDQSLVKMITRDGNLKLPEGVIIVDEAHERSIPIDLLLGLIKQALPESPNTKVIITSATIDAQKFSNFFDGAPIVEVPGQSFPIVTNVVRLMQGEHHSQGAARAAKTVIDMFLTGRGLVPLIDGMSELLPISRGTVLVLLPGKEDIVNVMQEISKHAKNCNADTRIQVLECHGETESKADDLIDQPLEEGVLRFVCATEVVRTSVTISEIVGVIDSLQIKRPIANAKGVVHLKKITISRAEADQGKGRAGRDRTGFYCPVSFSDEYETLKSQPLPATVYSPITKVALSVAAIGMSIRTFPLLDPPDKDRVVVAIQRLQRLGLFNAAEKITARGEKVEAISSLQAETAASLFKADELSVLPEAVIASAVHENEGGIFYWHSDKDKNKDILADKWLLEIILRRCCKVVGSLWGSRWQECPDRQVDPNLPLPEWVEVKEEDKRFLIKCGHPSFPDLQKGARWIADLVRERLAGPERSDFSAAICAYRAYKDNDKIITQFFNCKKLGMIDFTINQTLVDLAGTDLRVSYKDITDCGGFDGAAVVKALATGLIDNILTSECNRWSTFSGPLGDDITLYRSSACPQDAMAILVNGVQQKNVNRYGTTDLRSFADMAALVQPAWLPEVMPQLCELSRLGDHYYNSNADSVFETQLVKFVDLDLNHQVPSIDVTGAARAFAVAVHRGVLPMLQEILRHNAEVQRNLENFNVRSGGATPLLADREIVEHYATVFCTYSVTSVESYRRSIASGSLKADHLKLSLEYYLPMEKRKEVHVNNPYTIVYLGKERAVAYNKGESPRLVVEEDLLEGDLWKRITDCVLPGGRHVQVELRCPYYFESISAEELRDRIKIGVHERLWMSFQKPNMAIPDPSLDTEQQIPEVVAVCYGNDVLTGEPLHMYGTVARNYYGNSPLTIKWFAERKDAENRRTEVRESFLKLQTQAAEERDYETALQEARPIKERVVDLIDEDHLLGFQLPSGLREDLVQLRWASDPTTATEARALTARRQEIVRRVEAYFAGAKEREAHKQAIKKELSELGASNCQVHLLVDEQGNLFVGAAKWATRFLSAQIKGQSAEFMVEPSEGVLYGDSPRISIDAEGRFCKWFAVSFNCVTTISDQSGAGNMAFRIKSKFRTPAPGMLTPGVWCVLDGGTRFCSVIYYREGREVVPENMVVVNSAPSAPSPTSPGNDKPNQMKTAGNASPRGNVTSRQDDSLKDIKAVFERRRNPGPPGGQPRHRRW